jgi:hypothetical protein
MREDVAPVKIVPPPVVDTKPVSSGSDKTGVSKEVSVVVPAAAGGVDQSKDANQPVEQKSADVPPTEKKEDGTKPTDNKEGEKPTDSPDVNKTDEKTEPQSDSKEQSGDDNKVTICHQPPGKPAERKTMTVPKSAVNAHLAHGDYLGECKAEEKKDDKNKTKGKDGNGMTSLFELKSTILIASNSDISWLYIINSDTTKVYGKVKATVRQYRKTVTSRGVLNFRIVDARTNAVITEERMPSESVWVSEWLQYNGDSRALSEEQKRLAQQRELPQPKNQDMFAEFTRPLFDQITTKLTEFYRNY